MPGRGKKPPPPVKKGPGLFSRRWFIALQVALAALLFMAITLLSQGIATRGLALLGMRTDVATIIAVEACGRKTTTAPAAVVSAADDRMRVEICKADAKRPEVRVTAAVPSGQPVTLLVNGSRAETRQNSAARVTFGEVKLHAGENRLAVAAGEHAINDLQFEPGNQSYRQTRFGLLRNLPVGEPITVAMPQAGTTARIVGGTAGPEGTFLLVSGPPDTSSEIEGLRHFVWIGPSGFATERVEALPSSVVTLTPEQFRRSVKVTRLPSGELVLSAEACLPADSALARWAREGTLSANDFFIRLSEMRFDMAPTGPPGRNARISTSASPGCRIIRSWSVIPVAAVSRWRGNLLSTPFDSLQFQGFGERLQFSQSPTSTGSSDTATFAGQWTDEDTLRVQPDYAIFVAEVNAAVERPSPPQPASRLARAWARAAEGLPIWLRALLSGIAAVVPVLVLIFVIRRTAPVHRPVAEARTEVLAGLGVLLFLALGTAAQPLLFQLFFRAADFLELWDILAETHGDGRSVYPDLYGPVAIAIALMLVPFLRALRYQRNRKQSVVIPLLSFVGSSAAVAVLFAAALVQRLPWQSGDKVWAVGLLKAQDVTVGPDITLPLVAAALVVAVATSWIPLYWAFQSMAPRRDYLVSSIVAGAAAIILPLVAYAVEAGHLLMPEPTRYSDEPSLLALLGGSVLPFILFLLLLRAFRKVITCAVPELQTERACRLLRNRNLILAATILTLPRLGLDQAAVAPSDMGIIDILSIFQSFGLVTAVLLAIVLLKAYSPFAPPGERVRDPLRPFAFGTDELDILAALFVGYLAMWTSGVLATVVAVAVGWPLFKRLIVEPELALPDELASPELASSLVDLRRDQALFEARGKQLEARYTKVESGFAELSDGRVAIQIERNEQERKLGMRPDEAKRRLLEFGPGTSPFENGLRGALAGLMFAVVLQLATSISRVGSTGPITSWAALARKALADPGYSIAPTGSQGVGSVIADLPRIASPDLLLFVGALINACFPWVLLGFIFGFAFHRIRGDDGVIKGLVFAIAIAIAYAFSQLFAPGADGPRIARVIPVFVFLLLVGVAAFDAPSLVRRKLSPLQLGDVYGFRTSLSYVSLIGGLAAIEPIVSVLRGLFPKQ